MDRIGRRTTQTVTAERGATMVEYAIILGIVALVFVAGIALIEPAAHHRANESFQAGEQSIPCGENLSGDACK